MRYWFLKMEIQSGDYTVDTSSVHKTPKQEEFDGNAYAQDFWNDGEETYGDGIYYFDCGCIACSVIRLTEITKKEYDIMRKHL